MTDGSTTGPRRRERAPTTPDPIEMAMEAEAAGHAPSGVAARVLEGQERLIAADLKHRGWQIASERAGFAVKVLTASAGVAAAGLLGLLAWQASRADGVVVEPFTVPPELAQRGLSGSAISAQVLDELASLEAQTEQGSIEGGFRGDQPSAVRVAIPATGVSLGELQVALRDWLGHETHVSGEVYGTPGRGVAIRARITGRAGVRVEGAEGELEDLARRAAHGIFAQTRPARYASWLGAQGDRAGAVRIYRAMAEGDGLPVQRAVAYHSWAFWIQGEDPVGAIALLRESVALNPHGGSHWAQLAVPEGTLGHSEDVVAHRRQGLALQAKYPNRRVRPEARDPSYARVALAILTNDAPEALQQVGNVDRNRFNGRVYGAQLDGTAASALAMAHDVPGARDRVARPRFVNRDLGADVQETSLTRGKLAIAFEAEDWPALAALEPELTAPGFPVPANPALRVVNYQLALAHAQIGDAAGARARLPIPPADCAPCLQLAGRVHAALGEADVADRELAQAARLTPSLPRAVFWQGRVRLERGDAGGALPFLREAQRRQPHWADPFKFEGDALARLGRWAEADAAYAKAEPLAPKWGGLHLKRAEALLRLGKPEAARPHLAAASGLYLTMSERSELAAVSAKPAI